MSTAASNRTPPPRDTAKGKNNRRQTNNAGSQNQTSDDPLEPCSTEIDQVVIIGIANFTTNLSVDKLPPPHLAELRTPSPTGSSAFGFRIG
jgi:hypothetical protein